MRTLAGWAVALASGDQAEMDGGSVACEGEVPLLACVAAPSANRPHASAVRPGQATKQFPGCMLDAVIMDGTCVSAARPEMTDGVHRARENVPASVERGTLGPGGLFRHSDYVGMSRLSGKSVAGIGLSRHSDIDQPAEWKLGL